jgi:hypothetical protein
MAKRRRRRNTLAGGFAAPSVPFSEVSLDFGLFSLLVGLKEINYILTNKKQGIKPTWTQLAAQAFLWEKTWKISWAFLSCPS